MREPDAQIPHSDTVYEYFIDPKKRAWCHWEEKLNATTFKVNPETPFYKILVPTVDTLRYSALMAALVKAEKHLLFCGSVGVGKTSIVDHCLSTLDESFATATMNFSARTASTRVSSSIEARFIHTTTPPSVHTFCSHLVFTHVRRASRSAPRTRSRRRAASASGPEPALPSTSRCPHAGRAPRCVATLV